MLADIVRHGRFTAEEFRSLATERPIDIAGLSRRIRAMLEAAEVFIKQMPTEAVGLIFLDGGLVVQPDPAQLQKYVRHTGKRRGHWPSSPEIGSAMLERYAKPDQS
jgi:hypothetical protein